MARSEKTTVRVKTAAEPPTAVGSKRRTGVAASPPPSLPPTKTKAARVAAVPKTAPLAAAPARVPPPSKGELRAHIEKLEATNVSLKAKGREANRAAKVAARRIAELEEQVGQLQKEVAKPVAPVAPPAEVTAARRGRPPGRKKAIDPGAAVPPGVAVGEPEPLDAEAEAAREALAENLPGKQARE